MDVKVKTRLESKNEVIDRVGRFEWKLQGAQQQSIHFSYDINSAVPNFCCAMDQFMPGNIFMDAFKVSRINTIK